MPDVGRDGISFGPSIPVFTLALCAADGGWVELDRIVWLTPFVPSTLSPRSLGRERESSSSPTILPGAEEGIGRCFLRGGTRIGGNDVGATDDPSTDATSSSFSSFRMILKFRFLGFLGSSLRVLGPASEFPLRPRAFLDDVGIGFLTPAGLDDRVCPISTRSELEVFIVG